MAIDLLEPSPPLRAQAAGRHTDAPVTSWWLVPVLALTLVIVLLWSHQKLLWFDELLELQTDGAGSAREVITIQRHLPISLDPAGYHLLTHFATRLLGVTAFGVRFPAMCGFLLLQLCLFVFARRMAGGLAGVLAAGLPALSGTLLYAVEARPYGMLMGLYGVVLVCYQAATRGLGHRAAALAGLGLAVALAINTHYFGVLVLVPVCLAEAVRLLQRRSLDGWLLAALALGAGLGTATMLPFYPAAARYGLHYYADGTVTPHTLTLCYRVLFLSDKQFGASAQRLVMALLVVGVVAAFATFLVWQRSRRIDAPAAEVVLVVAVAALPLFGYAVAVLATHTMAIRYVFPAIFGFSVVVACAVAPLLRTPGTRVAGLAVLLLGIGLMGLFHIGREREHRAQVMRDLAMPAEIRARVLASGDPHLYMLNVFPYEAYARYEPDGEIRRRLTLLYSFDQEMQLRGRDTNALTAEHMRVFTGFPIVSWEQMHAQARLARPSWHAMVLTDDAWWDWGRDALSREHAEVRVLGKALGGTVVEVRWPADQAQLSAEPWPASGVKSTTSATQVLR